MKHQKAVRNISIPSNHGLHAGCLGILRPSTRECHDLDLLQVDSTLRWCCSAKPCASLTSAIQRTLDKSRPEGNLVAETWIWGIEMSCNGLLFRVSGPAAGFPLGPFWNHRFSFPSPYGGFIQKPCTVSVRQATPATKAVALLSSRLTAFWAAKRKQETYHVPRHASEASGDFHSSVLEIPRAGAGKKAGHRCKWWLERKCGLLEVFPYRPQST
jgi:hypothetical protein